MNKLKKTALCAFLIGLSFAPISAQNRVATLDEEQLRPIENIHHTVHELESLFVLMQERFALMHEIARYKWNMNQKDQLLNHEELVLNEMGQENDAFMCSFFNAQNAASSRLQADDFRLFEQEQVGKFDSVRDYETEIAVELRAINQEMISTINQLLVHTQNESLPSFLRDLSFSSFQHEGINRQIYDIAVDPLFQD